MLQTDYEKSRKAECFPAQQNPAIGPLNLFGEQKCLPRFSARKDPPCKCGTLGI